MAVLFSVFLALAVAVMLWAAAAQRSVAVAEQTMRARAALNSRQQALAVQAADYATWDEAFAAMHAAPDAAWMEKNIGGWVAQQFHVDMSFVVGPDGGTVFGMVDGEPTREKAGRLLGQGFDALIAAARARPIGAGPTSGIVETAGGPALVGVAPIRREDPGFDLAGRERSLLVFVDTLDDASLAQIASLFVLPGLHRMPGTPGDGETALDLAAADGEVIGHLAWSTGYSPWWRLGGALPIVVLALLVLTPIVLHVLRRVRRTVRAISTEEARARHLALHDALTGLPNRVLLRDRLDHALALMRRERTEVAMLLIDLDRFKPVNDTLGHAAGDWLLKAVATRLTLTGRASDTMARVGGDEFAALHVGVDSQYGAQRLAERLRDALALPFEFDGKPIVISSSIGIAVAPYDGTDGDALIRHADAALYAAKQDGRNTCRRYRAPAAEPAAGAEPAAAGS